MGLLSNILVDGSKRGINALSVSIEKYSHHCIDNIFSTCFVELKTNPSHPFSIECKMGI